jgi:hypothetical protein
MKMSFKTIAIDHMVNNGMWPDQAEKVFQEIKNDEANESMKGRWDDPQWQYPESMTAIVIMITNSAAVKWIDENLPKAWFRPMFTGEEKET